MARYTCSVTVAVALANLYPNLTEILKSCNLEVLIFREDYVMAREKPGQVPFAKLATVEVLVDSTRSTMHAADFELVVKNEELPLQSHNHCSQVYKNILERSAANPGWRLLSCSDQSVSIRTPAPSPQQNASSVSPASPTPSNLGSLPTPSATSSTSPPKASDSPSRPSIPIPSSASTPPTPASQSCTQKPASDPARFTSLPKVTPRTSLSVSNAESSVCKSNGTPQTPAANGANLTWQPSTSSPVPSEPEAPVLDSSSSFEEFLAAGKAAGQKEPEPPESANDSSPIQPMIVRQDFQSK
jgi:hypothetical protein